MSFSYRGDAKYVPFPLPILPPQVDPTDSPKISVCINEDWLPAILTCIKALCVEGSYIDADADAIALAVKRGQLLLSQFMQPSDQCAAGLPSILCISGSFKDLDYGFVPSGTIGCDAFWTSGTGWESCGPTGGDAKNVAIDLTFGSSTFLNSYEFCYTAEPLRVVNWSVDIYFEGNLVHQETGTDTLGGNACHGGTFGIQSDRIFFTVVYDDNTVTDDLVITDWKLCYTGDFPLLETDQWSHTFDFRNGQFGFSGVTFFGSTVSWVSGVGFESGGTPTTGTNVFCCISHGDEGQVVNYDSFELFGYSAGSTVSNSELVAVVWPDVANSGGFEVSNVETPSPTSPVPFLITDPINEQHVFIRLQIAPNSITTGDGTAIIESLRIIGRGFDPFA